MHQGRSSRGTIGIAGPLARAMIDLQLLIQEADELDPMPASATRLAALLAEEDWVLEDIVDVIELDPALTGRLLSRANSAASGSRVEIHSVHQAVTVLGL